MRVETKTQEEGERNTPTLCATDRQRERESETEKRKQTRKRKQETRSCADDIFIVSFRKKDPESMTQDIKTELYVALLWLRH